jgi:hypothetical protein
MFRIMLNFFFGSSFSPLELPAWSVPASIFFFKKTLVPAE